jgi:cell division protein FtsB
MENEDDLIRRYLLRELADEEERQRVEKRLMTDDAFFERLKMAEDELVDEYLGGELPQWEREKFELSFLTTPEGRQQVSFNTAFNRYVSEVAASRRPQPVPPRRGAFASMPAFFSGQGRFATAALVAACLLLIVSGVLGVRLWQLHGQLERMRASGLQGSEELRRQLTEEQARTAQLDQELQREKAAKADLKQQIAKLTGGQEPPERPEKEHPQRPFFALVLKPGTERGDGRNPELKLQPGTRSYPLKLILEADSYYPSYSETLRTVEGNEVPLAGNLKPTGPRSARSLVVNLPGDALRKGDYQLRTYGPAPEREHVGTYQFRVVE